MAICKAWPFICQRNFSNPATRCRVKLIWNFEIWKNTLKIYIFYYKISKMQNFENRTKTIRGNVSSFHLKKLSKSIKPLSRKADLKFEKTHWKFTIFTIKLVKSKISQIGKKLSEGMLVASISKKIILVLVLLIFTREWCQYKEGTRCTITRLHTHITAVSFLQQWTFTTTTYKYANIGMRDFL